MYKSCFLIQEIEEAPPELDMSSLCVDEDDMQNGAGNVVGAWLCHLLSQVKVLIFIHMHNSFCR